MSLGPQYRGTRVSREALDADEEEEEESEEEEDSDENILSENLNPDTPGSEQDGMSNDDELSQNNPKATTWKNKHAKRATAADFMESGEDEESEDEMGGSDDEIDESDDESDESGIEGFIDDEAEESDEDETAFPDEESGLSDDSDEEDQDDDEDSDDDDDDEKATELRGSRGKSKFLNGTGIAASVKEMMGEQSVVKSLLKTVDADVQKGRAVQRQRKGFDALLNVRIRLQKSVSWLWPLFWPITLLIFH